MQKFCQSLQKLSFSFSIPQFRYCMRNNERARMTSRGIVQRHVLNNWLQLAQRFRFDVEDNVKWCIMFLFTKLEGERKKNNHRSKMALKKKRSNVIDYWDSFYDLTYLGRLRTCLS